MPSGPGKEHGWLFDSGLETVDGQPAEPAELTVAAPNMRSGDTIPLGYRTLRVVDVRDDDAEQPPVLVVEDTAG